MSETFEQGPWLDILDGTHEDGSSRQRPDTCRDVPSIIGAFVSSSRRGVQRDEESERDESLAAGVREFWVIDRNRRIMTVNRPGPLGPTDQIVTEAEPYRTELLPGFELPLARLLAKADDWRRRRSRKPPAQGAD